MEPRVVLLLAGSSEAGEIARRLAPREDVHVVLSLAGITRAPHVPAGIEARRGGFGGPAGLAAWLRARDVAAVLDATHPFAARMQASATTACAAAGVPRAHVRRPAWRAVAGDRWHEAADLEAAAALVPALGSRVLLTVGGVGARAFASLPDPWFLVRAIEPPTGPLPPRHELLLGRGPFTLERERATLGRHRIDLVVARDSGGAATAAKLAAAREQGIPVIVVRRPPAPAPPLVDGPDAAIAWLRATVGATPSGGRT